MADNVAITAGSGTTVAADDVGGVLHQRVKLSVGDDGSAADAKSGAGTASGSLRVTVATDDGLHTKIGEVQASPTANTLLDRLKAIADKIDTGVATSLPSGTNPIGHVGGVEYEWVDASQTDQAMGTGATGDYLAGVLIVPGTTSPGAVAIQDGAGTARTIFTGGASSVSNLVPFYVPIGAKSTGGAWSITTGGNVTAIGFGDFT